jgi:hypothetical protein
MNPASAVRIATPATASARNQRRDARNGEWNSFDWATRGDVGARNADAEVPDIEFLQEKRDRASTLLTAPTGYIARNGNVVAASILLNAPPAVWRMRDSRKLSIFEKINSRWLKTRIRADQGPSGRRLAE